eukprot:scaffold13234_cov149-Ochromonas_danica.AAC.1
MVTDDYLKIKRRSDSKTESSELDDANELALVVGNGRLCSAKMTNLMLSSMRNEKEIKSKLNLYKNGFEHADD